MQGFAPFSNKASRSNATPYFTLNRSRCAFSPDNVLSVKHTTLLLMLPSSAPDTGLNTYGDEVPNQPVAVAINIGLGGTVPRSKISFKICCASTSDRPSFCLIKCVSRNEQSVLFLASTLACSALVWGISLFTKHNSLIYEMPCLVIYFIVRPQFTNNTNNLTTVLLNLHFFGANDTVVGKLDA